MFGKQVSADGHSEAITLTNRLDERKSSLRMKKDAAPGTQQTLNNYCWSFQTKMVG